jgi:hypothetical protein
MAPLKLKTGKSLGLTLPTTLLGRADQGELADFRFGKREVEIERIALLQPQ